MKSRIFSRIGYKDIFNESVDIKSILSKIEIEPALEFLVVLNKYEHNVYHDKLSDLNFICNNWLANSSEELKSKIIKCYTATLKKNKDSESSINDVKIINKAATLRAIELLLSESANRDMLVINYQNDEEELFMLYLAINDEIAEREKDFFKKYLDFKDDTKMIRFHLFLGLNQFIMNSESSRKKLWAEALKFVLFEKWIKSQNKYDDLTNIYLSQFDVKDWYELFNIIFALNSLVINHYKFKVEVEGVQKIFFKYISNHKESSSHWNEFSEIRKMPLYRISNESYLVLDFSFLLDKFFSGIYHDILQQLDNNDVKSFHQDFSNDFVEKFLLVNALKAVFGKKYIQFDENKIKEYNIKGINNLALPDYYVRNGNKVFLFECKNSLLSNQSKLDSEYKDIEREIKEKFYEYGKKKKAVRQLLNYFELAQNMKYNFFDSNAKLENCIYYPILVTTDLTLTSLGFNKLLNEYMDNDIDKLDINLKRRIKPLTIIHINDLLVRTSKIQKLDVVIDDYYKYCGGQELMDSMISFSEYLDRFKFGKNYNFDHNSFKAMIKDSFLS